MNYEDEIRGLMEIVEEKQGYKEKVKESGDPMIASNGVKQLYTGAREWFKDLFSKLSDKAQEIIARVYVLNIIDLNDPKIIEMLKKEGDNSEEIVEKLYKRNYDIVKEEISKTIGKKEVKILEKILSRKYLDL